MLRQARHASKFFSKGNILYDQKPDGQIIYLKPKKSSLKSRLKCEDPQFVDFIHYLLTLHGDKRYIFLNSYILTIIIRPTASEALKHPFIQQG